MTWLGTAAVVSSAAGCVPPSEQAPPRVVRPGPPRFRRPPAPARPEMKEVVLPSGLRILLEEDPFATVAGVVSVVRGGAGADPPGLEGLAHLVEHLSFRAVDPAPAGARALTRWDRLTKSAVAEMNGFTTHDWLMFYEFAPVSRLRGLLDLEVARLADPLVGVEEGAFALERQVIGSEHLLREDPRAGGWAMNALTPLLFPLGHPYARPVGGTEDTRRKLTLAQARAYAASAFRPERITVLVTAPPGATTLNAIIDGLPVALQGDPAHPVPRPEARTIPSTSTAPPAALGRADERAAEPAATPAGDGTGADGAGKERSTASGGAVRIERKHSALPTPELWIAWTLPGAFNGDLGPTEQVLERWVQDDLGFSQVSQEEPKIRHVSASVRPGADASVLYVRVLLAEGAEPERAAQVVIARITSLWAREPVERQSFVQFKDLYETQNLLHEPSQLPRALEEAIAAAFSARSQTMADLLTSAKAVPSSAVAQFAYRHLTRDRAHAVMFSPTPASAEALRAAVAGRFAPADEPPPELVAGAAGWDPRELAALLPPAVDVVSKVLPGGLTVITVRRPAAAVAAWLGFRGGYANSDPPLLVELALRARPDARQATKLHILPGRGATQDLSFDMVEFLPSQLPDGLTLLFAKATAPVKEWPTREGQQRMLAPVAAAEDGAVTKATRDFWRALFGDHPYARLVQTGDLDKFTQSDVDAWVGRVHNMRNAALVVVGDVDPAEVERGAEILARRLTTPAWIADLPAPAPPAAHPANGERTVSIVTARPGSLAEIRLGCLLPRFAAADRGHFELLRHAMEARLNTALRIDHGDGYGVNVAYDWLRGGTTFLVTSTFVNDQGLARTLGALHSHWQRWGRDGFDAGELNVARWRYAGSVPLAQASGHALAYRLLATWSNEPAALAQEHLRPDLTDLRASRVNELFATCRANAVLGVTGNETVIRRALEQAWPGLSARARPNLP